MVSFPNGKFRDQIDAAFGAFNRLALGISVAAADRAPLVSERAPRHSPLNSAGVPVGDGLSLIDAEPCAARRYLRRDRDGREDRGSE